jgi:class 3 adenylate cyclase
MPVPRLRRTSSMASMLPGGAPIADHFDNCTVLFADLVAFTRWSADVTPERVFALLEAVFGEFDAAARRLGVFKVETIGDWCVVCFGFYASLINFCYVLRAVLTHPSRDAATWR